MNLFFIAFKNLTKGEIMHDHKEMSEEKRVIITAKLKELGVDESMIDDRLMWSVKKASFGLMKLRLVLSDKGVDDAKSREVIDKLVDEASKKDLTEVKEWYEKRKAEKLD